MNRRDGYLTVEERDDIHRILIELEAILQNSHAPDKSVKIHVVAKTDEIRARIERYKEFLGHRPYSDTVSLIGTVTTTSGWLIPGPAGWIASALGAVISGANWIAEENFSLQSKWTVRIEARMNALLRRLV